MKSRPTGSGTPSDIDWIEFLYQSVIGQSEAPPYMMPGESVSDYYQRIVLGSLSKPLGQTQDLNKDKRVPGLNSTGYNRYMDQDRWNRDSRERAEQKAQKERQDYEEYQARQAEEKRNEERQREHDAQRVKDSYETSK